MFSPDLFMIGSLWPEMDGDRGEAQNEFRAKLTRFAKPLNPSYKTFAGVRH